MGNFAIGLSGLKVAQNMIDLVSTNIANAHTEGYHRQEAIVRPVILKTYGNVGIGGAEVSEVRRQINNLLELEITRQQAGLSQASEELDVLRTVESAFGEAGSEGLAVAMDRFFDSLTELASDPSSQTLRVQAAWSADSVAGEFRSLGLFFSELEEQMRRQAQGHVNKFNDLAFEVHDLTNEMDSLSIHGGVSNLIRDRRDQAIREMAELADIQTVGLEDDTSESLCVSAWGTPVVSRSGVMQLETAVNSDGALGVGTKDSGVWRSGARGGRIGAMLAMHNDIISSVRGNLDTLANKIITAINNLHVQGVGAGGSFTELTGTLLGDQAVGQWDANVGAGSFHVRLTNTTTGAVTRSKIDVDLDDTVTDICALLDAVGGLSASVVNSTLKISADTGYKFDFLPALLDTPYTSSVTGDAVATMSGVYNGATNQIFTCKVVGDGKVGVADNLLLEVRDGGQLVETLNIGQGYAAGDQLDIGAGMTVALSAGQFNNDDEFTIQALADSDTSGFLSAAGLNTLFSGTDASNITVRDDILAEPRRIAGSISAAMTDGANINRMIAVGEDLHTALGDASVRDYFRDIVTGVGQAVIVREARTADLGGVMEQLETQRDKISGVDINEETAKLIVLERMYQGMAKVVSTQDQMLASLIDLI